LRAKVQSIQSGEESTLNSLLSSRVASKVWKASEIVLCGFLIGVFDAWQAIYLPIGSFGEAAAILYQVLLIAVAGIAAVVFLRVKSWSFWRNALSVLVAIPIAAISDNVSLDLQLMKPYLIILPSNGFAWRLQVFQHTILYPLASWVDLQTFAPGLIDGYVAAIGLAAAYVLMQLCWDKINFASIVQALYAKLLFARHFAFRR
jgi:hypothetical protein